MAIASLISFENHRREARNLKMCILTTLVTFQLKTRFQLKIMFLLLLVLSRISNTLFDLYFHYEIVCHEDICSNEIFSYDQLLSMFQCSASCGTGLRLRKVRCYADSRIDYSEETCRHLKRPASVELCNRHSCSGMFITHNE